MPDKSAIKGSAKLRAFRREKNTRLKAGLLDYLEEPMNAGRVIADMALTEPTEPAVLPRHIWMYWHDGWENAPDIARLCRQSWIERNPGYAVHALDYGSLSGFLPDPLVHYEATKLNSFANRVRLRLLRIHGGVWADATNFCTQPVDPWIADKVSAARLFAFTLPNAERPIATWFLAATLQSPLVAAWEELIALYFEHIQREVRPVHAYFFMPYIFEFAIGQSPYLQSLWDRMPKVPVTDTGLVSGIAKLQLTGQTSSLPPERCAKIAAALTETTMQKLTWKGAMRERSPAALQVLDMLRVNLGAFDGKVGRFPGFGPA
jgi:hypothetical protein